MTEAEHKAAFLKALEGVKVHHAIAAVTQMTVGIQWTRCSKSDIAERYAEAKAKPTGHYANAFKNLNDLSALREAALLRQRLADEAKVSRALADKLWAEQRAKERAEKEAEAARRERLIAAVDLIEARIKAAPSYGMAEDIQRIINQARNPGA